MTPRAIKNFIRFLCALSGKRPPFRPGDTVARQHGRERIVDEIGVFALANVVSGSSRFNSSSTKPGWHITTLPSGRRSRKRGNSAAKFAGSLKCIGAGKGRIGAHAELCGAAAEAAQDVEQQPLAIAETFRSGSTRPHCRTHAFGSVLDQREERVADLRKQMHMLVAVDEVGRAAEARRNGATGARLLPRAIAVEAAHAGMPGQRCERQEGAPPVA